MRRFFTNKFFSPVHCRRQWRDWEGCPLADRLNNFEKELLAPIIEKKYGNQLLQVSMGGGKPLFESSPINQKTLLHFEYPVEGIGHAIVGTPEELPIQNEQLDLIILHHVLEYSKRPHQILREAQRSLASGGQMVVVGFNPWSLWQVRKLLTVNRRAPWNGRYLSEGRLSDWLRLLDFKVEDNQFGYFSLPMGPQWLSNASIGIEKIGRRFNFPLGCFYILIARKQTAGSIPIRERKHKPRLLALPIAKPTARNPID